MRQKFVRFKKKHYLCSANFFHVDLLEHHLNKNKMKRVFFLLVAIMSMLAAQAQSQSCVIRSGNTYVVNGDVMNKKAFDGFLKNTNTAAYTKFHSGYKISKAGWGLFGGGLGLGTAAFAMALATPAVAEKMAETDGPDEAVAQTSIGYTTGMVLTFVAGSAITTAGIVCLGVGYGRMHNAADVYNVDCQKKPVAELQLTAGRGTIGLACKF